MARAARAAAAIVAVLGALAAAPAIAAAGVVADTQVTLPAQVTVGQTITASITLTNLNSPSNQSDTNTVCEAGDASPCDGSGVTLLPACGQLSGNVCFPGSEDPGVFVPSGAATGRAGTECAGLLFDVTVVNAPTGALLVAPQGEGTVTLAGNGASCTIDVPLAVTAMPTIDEDPSAGVQTAQVAAATQTASGLANSDTGASQTTVAKAQPAIATAASGGIVLGSGTIADTATVSGRASPVPGATVEFKLFGPGDASCATPISTTAATVSDAGTATSAAFSPTRAGTYRWVASYSGDANNAPATGACNAAGESVTVSPATPAIAIAASPDVVSGGGISATATVSGRVNPAAGSTVAFSLYGPDDAACSGTPAFTATAALSVDGAATSGVFTPPPARTGVYRWIASFGGDADNSGAATACNAAGSTVTVSPLPAQILSAGFATAPRVGQPAFLTVQAVDPARPISGIQVQFGEPRGLSGISACSLSGFAFSPTPVQLRLPFTFRRAGRHTIRIFVLSGGCSDRLTVMQTTIVVVVGASRSARGAFAASASGSAATVPLATAAQATCKNAFLRPASKALSRLKVAAAILCLVNAERAKKGLRKLRRSRVLAVAAGGHSRDMLKRRYFEHAGPGGPSLQKRLTRARYRGRTAGENIGYGSNFNAKLIVQAWMNSPPHRANILSPKYKFAGVGIAVGVPVTPQRPGSTYTLDFGATLK